MVFPEVLFLELLLKETNPLDGHLRLSGSEDSACGVGVFSSRECHHRGDGLADGLLLRRFGETVGGRVSGFGFRIVGGGWVGVE